MLPSTWGLPWVSGDRQLSRPSPETLPSLIRIQGFPGGSDGEEPACSPGDLGTTPGSGRPPGEEVGTPLLHSHLGDLMDSGAWQTTVHGPQGGQMCALGHVG